ncbi:MAG: protease inhibitor I9 family protein, partial [Dokdonella sp.]
MISFDQSGTLDYRGGIPGLRGTAAANAGERFNAKSPEALAYRQHLENLQAAKIADIRSSLSRDVEVPHTYQITHSGIAAKLTAAEAAQVAAMPGVRSVKLDKIYQLDTFRGPSFIGAETVWGGTVPTPATATNFGKGVVIGVLDSGVNATHPSFANDVRCGFGPADVKLRSFVDCSTSAAGVCTGPNPIDTNGHGTHTASTSGGNVVGATRATCSRSGSRSAAP